MALPDLYSRRKRQSLQSPGSDVYSYDAFPHKIRFQLMQVMGEGLGPYEDPFGLRSRTADIYDYIVRVLRREKAVYSLVANAPDARAEFCAWFEWETDVDATLDGLELALRCIDQNIRGHLVEHAFIYPDEAIAEANARLLEAGMGYQYVSGRIIRLDSTIIHHDVVLPALRLLGRTEFVNADQEYRDAHDAYRHGEYTDCLVDCAKALESVLKIIGSRRGWPIQPTDPASRLIQAAKNAGFLAAYHEAATNHLVGLLTASVPTIRNRLGGHGAGTEPVVVSQPLAAFQLHQTAAVLLFLLQHDASIG